MASQYDYERIKAIAKASKLKVTDLIALAPQNDPFYAGTPADWQAAQWFADVWRQAGYMGGVHLRRVHYWCVSREPVMPNGKAYENTDKCWSFISQASKMARYLGLISIADIVDHKNPPPVINAQYSRLDKPSFEIEIPQLNDPYVYIEGIELANGQPYHIEIWCEKSTMNDVLEPLCRRYNANLATFEGEVSISACYDLTVKRIEASGRKPTRIFYISDFDPAGKSMPVAMARKVEYMLNKYGQGYDVKLKPIVLTEEQVKRYKLPRTPIKESERRASSFQDAFGVGATELDALEALYPGVLEGIVSAEVEPYFSHEAARKTAEKRDALQQAISKKLDEITSRYQQQIEALNQMFLEMAEVEIDTTGYRIEPVEIEQPESTDEWLFDSSRGYVEQINYYKAHKGVNMFLKSADSEEN